MKMRFLYFLCLFLLSSLVFGSDSKEKKDSIIHLYPSQDITDVIKIISVPEEPETSTTSHPPEKEKVPKEEEISEPSSTDNAISQFYATMHGLITNTNTSSQTLSSWLIGGFKQLDLLCKTEDKSFDLNQVILTRYADNPILLLCYLVYIHQKQEKDGTLQMIKEMTTRVPDANLKDAISTYGKKLLTEDLKVGLSLYSTYQGAIKKTLEYLEKQSVKDISQQELKNEGLGMKLLYDAIGQNLEKTFLFNTGSLSLFLDNSLAFVRFFELFKEHFELISSTYLGECAQELAHFYGLIDLDQCIKIMSTFVSTLDPKSKMRLNSMLPLKTYVGMLMDSTVDTLKLVRELEEKFFQELSNLGDRFLQSDTSFEIMEDSYTTAIIRNLLLSLITNQDKTRHSFHNVFPMRKQFLKDLLRKMMSIHLTNILVVLPQYEQASIYARLIYQNLIKSPTEGCSLAITGSCACHFVVVDLSLMSLDDNQGRRTVLRVTICNSGLGLNMFHEYYISKPLIETKSKGQRLSRASSNSDDQDSSSETSLQNEDRKSQEEDQCTLYNPLATYDLVILTSNTFSTGTTTTRKDNSITMEDIKATILPVRLFNTSTNRIDLIYDGMPKVTRPLNVFEIIRSRTEKKFYRDQVGGTCSATALFHYTRLQDDAVNESKTNQGSIVCSAGPVMEMCFKLEVLYDLVNKLATDYQSGVAHLHVEKITELDIETPEHLVALLFFSQDESTAKDKEEKSKLFLDLFYLKHCKSIRLIVQEAMDAFKTLIEGELHPNTRERMSIILAYVLNTDKLGLCRIDDKRIQRLLFRYLTEPEESTWHPQSKHSFGIFEQLRRTRILKNHTLYDCYAQLMVANHSDSINEIKKYLTHLINLKDRPFLESLNKLIKQHGMVTIPLNEQVDRMIILIEVLKHPDNLDLLLEILSFLFDKATYSCDSSKQKELLKELFDSLSVLTEQKITTNVSLSIKPLLNLRTLLTQEEKGAYSLFVKVIDQYLDVFKVSMEEVLIKVHNELKTLCRDFSDKDWHQIHQMFAKVQHLMNQLQEIKDNHPLICLALHDSMDVIKKMREYVVQSRTMLTTNFDFKDKPQASRVHKARQCFEEQAMMGIQDPFDVLFLIDQMGNLLNTQVHQEDLADKNFAKLREFFLISEQVNCVQNFINDLKQRREEFFSLIRLIETCIKEHYLLMDQKSHPSGNLQKLERIRQQVGDCSKKSLLFLQELAFEQYIQPLRAELANEFKTLTIIFPNQRVTAIPKNLQEQVKKYKNLLNDSIKSINKKRKFINDSGLFQWCNMLSLENLSNYLSPIPTASKQTPLNAQILRMHVNISEELGIFLDENLVKITQTAMTVLEKNHLESMRLCIDKALFAKSTVELLALATKGRSDRVVKKFNALLINVLELSNDLAVLFPKTFKEDLAEEETKELLYPINLRVTTCKFDIKTVTNVFSPKFLAEISNLKDFKVEKRAKAVMKTLVKALHKAFNVNRAFKDISPIISFRSLVEWEHQFAAEFNECIAFTNILAHFFDFAIPFIEELLYIPCQVHDMRLLFKRIIFGRYVSLPSQLKGLSEPMKQQWIEDGSFGILNRLQFNSMLAELNSRLDPVLTTIVKVILPSIKAPDISDEDQEIKQLLLTTAKRQDMPTLLNELINLLRKHMEKCYWNLQHHIDSLLLKNRRNGHEKAFPTWLTDYWYWDYETEEEEEEEEEEKENKREETFIQHTVSWSEEKQQQLDAFKEDQKKEGDEYLEENQILTRIFSETTENKEDAKGTVSNFIKAPSFTTHRLAGQKYTPISINTIVHMLKHLELVQNYLEDKSKL